MSKIVIDPSGFFAQDCYSISKGKTLYCSLQNPVSLNPMTSGYREASYIAKEIGITPQEIQFIEKWHAAFLTEKSRGISASISEDWR